MTIVARNTFPVTQYRVIFGDTDAGGIVYHPRYLELAERGRNEIMRHLGLDVGHLFAVENFGLALRGCQLKFHRPALFDDLLTIQTSLSKLRAASSVWKTKIKCGPTEICTVSAEIICMDRIKHQPAMYPAHVMAAFQVAKHVRTKPVAEVTS